MILYGENTERHDLRLHDLVEDAMRKEETVRPPNLGDIILTGID